MISGGTGPVVAEGHAAQLHPAGRPQTPIQGGDGVRGGWPAVGARLLRAFGDVLEALHVRFERLTLVGELDESPDGREEQGCNDVESHQPAQGQLAGHHLGRSEGQHRRAAQNHEQPRQRRVEMAELDKALARDQLAGLMAAPAGKEAIVRSGHPQGIGLVHHQRADTHEQTLLASQSVALVDTNARDQAQKRRVRQRQPQHDQRQLPLVGQHDGQKHRAHHDIDEQRQEMLGQALGNLVDGEDTAGQLADKAMVEEVHWQTQQSRHVAIPGGHRNLDSQTLQTPPLEPGQAIDQDCGGHHDTGHEPAPGFVLQQDTIHEDDEQRRCHKGQHGQRQPASDRIGQRATAAAEPSRDPVKNGGSRAARLECRTAFELQRNPRKATAELGGRERAAARRRIVEKEARAVEAFEDEKVVELPEQDERERHLLEHVQRYRAAGALEAVVLGGARDAGGAGAVPADLAFLAQFGERHPAPEKCKHAAQAGGTAFGRMHL